MFDAHFKEVQEYADREGVEFPHHFGLKLIQWRNAAIQAERERIAQEIMKRDLGEKAEAYATQLLALPPGKLKPVCVQCAPGRKVDPNDPDRHYCLNTNPQRRAGMWCWCLQCNPEQTGPPEARG